MTNQNAQRVVNTHLQPVKVGARGSVLIKNVASKSLPNWEYLKVLVGAQHGNRSMMLQDLKIDQNAILNIGQPAWVFRGLQETGRFTRLTSWLDNWLVLLSFQGQVTTEVRETDGEGFELRLGTSSQS